MAVPKISFTLDAKSGGPGADAGSDLFSKTATPTLDVTVGGLTESFWGFEVQVGTSTFYVSASSVLQGGGVYSIKLPTSDGLKSLTAESVTVTAVTRTQTGHHPATYAYPPVIVSGAPFAAANTITYDGVAPTFSNLLVQEGANPSGDLTTKLEAGGFTVTGNVNSAANEEDLIGKTVTATISVDVHQPHGPDKTIQIVETATVQSNGSFSIQFTGADAAELQYSKNGTAVHIGLSVTDAEGVTGTTTIKAEAYCFLAGTSIATPSGPKNIEDLSAGDLVLTAEGQEVAARWIGVQTVSTVFADALRVLPIRIKAGALAQNVPSRDLLVSPDHALFIEGVLVQAGALVNGSTITREAHLPSTFTYYHLETADHSLILAENTPAETFIDNVDRMAFDNWREHEALGEGEPILEMSYPRAKSQRQVPTAIRRRLTERAEALGCSQSAAA